MCSIRFSPILFPDFYPLKPSKNTPKHPPNIPQILPNTPQNPPKHELKKLICHFLIGLKNKQYKIKQFT